MEIVIIGTGNTATVLGKKCKAAGHSILQVYGRNLQKAHRLAAQLESLATGSINQISPDADIYILALADRAIPEFVQQMKLGDKVVVHTAAAVPCHALKPASNHYGVLYPLQSMRRELEQLPDMPLLIDASDDRALEVIRKLAVTISDKIVMADDAYRLKLHLAAVMVNNFVNHLYRITEAYCKMEHLDFGLLRSLIRETAGRLDYLSPAHAQTGPAVRRDEATIQQHLLLLEKYPPLKELYQHLTDSISGWNETSLVKRMG
jgi:predicted short-subunit dehydrogenase-like oxidoreductase (DUF2520 family)